MSINLSCITRACFNIPLDELVETVFDQREELFACVHDLHENIKFFNGCYTIYLTDWLQATIASRDEPTLVAVTGSFRINDPTHLSMSIFEGYKYDDETEIHDSDAFLDIKPTRECLSQAIEAINNGTLPLHNKGLEITEALYPYAIVQEDEE